MPFLVTEYVPGPTLNEHVERAGPLRGEALTRFAAGVAGALARGARRRCRPPRSQARQRRPRARTARGSSTSGSPAPRTPPPGTPRPACSWAASGGWRPRCCGKGRRPPPRTSSRGVPSCPTPAPGGGPSAADRTSPSPTGCSAGRRPTSPGCRRGWPHSLPRPSRPTPRPGPRPRDWPPPSAAPAPAPTAPLASFAVPTRVDRAGRPASPARRGGAGPGC